MRENKKTLLEYERAMDSLKGIANTPEHFKELKELAKEEARTTKLSYQEAAWVAVDEYKRNFWR